MHSFEEIKQLLENSSIYYLVAIDMNSNYSYLNNRYKHVFNGIHGDLVGQHYLKTMHPDDSNICITVSEQCFKYPEKIFPAIIRKHDGKGGYIITQWEYKAMFNEAGHPAGVFCIGNDITEFMNASINLKETEKSLKVARITLEEIAYTQSHVVRKPIANILGLTLLLENMEIDEHVKSIIDMINLSTKELDEVINTLHKKI
jgi:PAS domain S-box-containing protein